ncbi:MAG TPA: F0F1 ATP synthase subunit gamma [Steroidobacteraceae bacterium]|jgi:F-type H+-transporting ATPase subunit gamma
MPGTKEIRTKIASVKSTQKITKALEMVAASKISRAQERMRRARPYATMARRLIGHLKQVHADSTHPYLLAREPHAVGILVISTDRGLCGALNANVFKTTLSLVREWQQKGASVSLDIVGSKGLTFFRRLDLPIVASVTGLGDQPHLRDLIGPVKVMLDAYREDRLDRVFLVHAQFVNTMTQRPRVLQLLPVLTQADGESDKDAALPAHWDYIYEPSVDELLDGLLMRYIESQVYQGAVESVASEMAARMVAMKSASDNATDLIAELQLVYNKARQAGITKELAEIVGGAAAV